MPIDSGVLTGRDNPRNRDYGIALLRIFVGIVFLAHGYLKLFQFGIAGTQGFFKQIGAPLPEITSVLIMLLETVGAILLILGILTPIVAACFIIDMLGAIYLTKLGGGFLAPKGPELELLLLVACVTLILTGPGALSLQRVFPRRA